MQTEKAEKNHQILICLQIKIQYVLCTKQSVIRILPGLASVGTNKTLCYK